jgi:hypothetical protein
MPALRLLLGAILLLPVASLDAAGGQAAGSQVPLPPETQVAPTPAPSPDVASDAPAATPFNARTSTEPAAPAAEQTSVGMELMASRPVIRVSINGHGPVPFLLGPEDQPTLIDLALAETLKMSKVAKGGPDPTVEVGFGSGTPLRVAVRVSDLASALSEFAPAVRPRGIISLSAWKDYLVTIDYSRWRLTFERGGLPEPNGKDVFALSATRDLQLPLSLAERSIECRIDPLFPGGLLLPTSDLGELPTSGKPREWGVYNTREGAVHVREARLATTLTLGPYEVKAPVVMLADDADTAMIGTQWLRRFSVTYDLTNARARLERPIVR